MNLVVEEAIQKAKDKKWAYSEMRLQTDNTTDISLN